MDRSSWLALAGAAAGGAALWFCWRSEATKNARPALSVLTADFEDEVSCGLWKRSITGVKDLSKDELYCVLRVADRCQRLVKRFGCIDVLKSFQIGLIFLEPSTRTRCSFEAAAKRLGASAVNIVDNSTSSMAKGETLEDGVRMMSGYCDLLVLRHPEKGAAESARDAATVPLLNAGDGIGEHPSQALLDFYTIAEFSPGILSSSRKDPIVVTFVGDLKNGRTVHSLSRLLAIFNVRLKYVAPPAVQIPDDVVEEVDVIFEKHNIKKEGRQVLMTDLAEALVDTDILYVTRMQRERFEDVEEYEKVKDAFRVDRKLLETSAPNSMKVLHPLPRVNEIATDVDTTSWQGYFRQAQNGLWVRMALLVLILGKSKSLADLDINVVSLTRMTSSNMGNVRGSRR